MLEKNVKAKLRAYLKSIGAWQYWPVKTMYGAKSVDCLFCYQGQFYGVETKRPGEKETALQRDCLGMIEAAGGKTCVEDDPELFNVKEMLCHK